MPTKNINCIIPTSIFITFLLIWLIFVFVTDQNFLENYELKTHVDGINSKGILSCYYPDIQLREDIYKMLSFCKDINFWSFLDMNVECPFKVDNIEKPTIKDAVESAVVTSNNLYMLIKNLEDILKEDMNWNHLILLITKFPISPLFFYCYNLDFVSEDFNTLSFIFNTSYVNTFLRVLNIIKHDESLITVNKEYVSVNINVFNSNNENILLSKLISIGLSKNINKLSILDIKSNLRKFFKNKTFSTKFMNTFMVKDNVMDIFMEVLNKNNICDNDINNINTQYIIGSDIF